MLYNLHSDGIDLIKKIFKISMKYYVTNYCLTLIDFNLYLCGWIGCYDL